MSLSGMDGRIPGQTVEEWLATGVKRKVPIRERFGPATRFYLWRGYFDAAMQIMTTRVVWSHPTPPPLALYGIENVEARSEGDKHPSPREDAAPRDPAPGDNTASLSTHSVVEGEPTP